MIRVFQVIECGGPGTRANKWLRSATGSIPRANAGGFVPAVRLRPGLI